MGDPAVAASRAPARGWRRGLRASGRRTNLALLALLAAAFVSGWLAFASGSAAAAVLTTVAHGMLGLAVVVLLPWKSMIIRRSTRRRVVSLVLTVLLAVCLLAGFVELFWGYRLLLGVSPIQLHVGTAVILGPLLLWHVLRSRRQRVRATDFSRRSLLRTASWAAAVTGGYVVLDAAAGSGRANTGSRPLEGSPVPATIWLFDRVPEIDGAEHRIDVAGATLTVADLRSRSQDVTARLDCTNGWYADATWQGVRLSDLVASEELSRAASIVVTSVSGYRRRFPATEASRLWLAVGYRGGPLAPGTGAPVRLVAPGRRGFWWVKWVASVELSPLPSWRQPPFPLS